MFVALLMLIYLVIATVGFVSWSRSRRAAAPSSQIPEEVLAHVPGFSLPGARRGPSGCWAAP